MFEHKSEPLLERPRFVRRMARHALIAFCIIAGSLLLGVIGYHYLEGQGWLDSLVNASMLLGGMGPVGDLHTTAGKLFASFFALFSGLVFILAAGVLFAPAYHRFLHKFHLDLDEADENEQPDE
jgi:hypothetical protein